MFVDLKSLPNSNDHKEEKLKRKKIFKKKTADSNRRNVMAQLGKFLDKGVLTDFLKEDDDDEIHECAMYVAGRKMGYKLRTFPKCKTAAIVLSQLRKQNFARIWKAKGEVK